MAFQKLQFNLLPKTKMLNHSKSFLTNISSRRSVRDFSDKAVPIELITNAIKAAASAPSGANKQPWYFVIVNDPLVKKERTSFLKNSDHTKLSGFSGSWSNV